MIYHSDCVQCCCSIFMITLFIVALCLDFIAVTVEKLF